VRFGEIEGGLTTGDFDFARQGQLAIKEEYGRIANLDTII
jgi:hypothetical protein